MTTTGRADTLTTWLHEAGARTHELVRDRDDTQMLGAKLDIVNPLLWEIGHVGWFYEYFCLRGRGMRPSIRSDADELYNSMAVAHDTRWDLCLPSRSDTMGYLEGVRERVARTLVGTPTDDALYFACLGVFHEDMHAEAFTYTHQTHGWPFPRLGSHGSAPDPGEAGPWPGDAHVAGGTYRLGAEPGFDPFVFDNEKWAHALEVAPFSIAKAPVTQAELARFADAGGYRDRALWTDDGWEWRIANEIDAPAYWRRDGKGWLVRRFDRWVPVAPHQPACHVSHHEALAYCAFAGRRLPTEAEWELAAAGVPSRGTARSVKRRFPWGDDPPDASRARLDWRGAGPCDVAAYPDGDSACGCRQMIGNVWEWTASDFLPYPGFEVDPYEDYSRPWFGTRKVLRGGCWATRGRLLRNTWRNYFTPERRDIYAGFRTCAL